MISKLIFAGYTGSKNQVRTRQKIKFVSKSIFFRVCNKLPNWHFKNQAQIDTVKITFLLSEVENVQAFEVLEKGHLQCHEFSPCIMWHLNAMQVTPYLTGNLRSNIFYVILDSTKVAVTKLNFAWYCSNRCPKKTKFRVSFHTEENEISK